MFVKKTANTEPVMIEPTASRRPTGSKPTPSIISADTAIYGNISSAGEIHVEGSVDGDVRASALVVGTGARINGEVAAENVHIRGEIIGTVRARSAILVSGCRVIGDIVNQSLEIEKGAHFEGASRHADDPLAVDSSKTSSAAGAGKKDSRATTSGASPVGAVANTGWTKPPAVAANSREPAGAPESSTKSQDKSKNEPTDTAMRNAQSSFGAGTEANSSAEAKLA